MKCVLLCCWNSQRGARLIAGSLLPIGNILNTLENKDVIPGDKELVHLNDYYFVSLFFLLYFSLSHYFRPYQVFTISFKWDQMGLHFLYHGGWLYHWKLWVPSKKNWVTKGRFLPLEGKAAFELKRKDNAAVLSSLHL